MMNMQSSDPRTAEFNVVPESADVAIIGGGIIGACTALFLAKKGVSVVLFEKGTAGEEQSTRNLGWVRKMGRDPREIPLMLRSMQNWDELERTIEAATGFHRCGITYFLAAESDAARYQPWLKAVAEFGLDTRMLNAAEASRLAPNAAHPIAGALHTPSDGCAEPHIVTMSILHGARKFGAKVVQACAVRGLETSGGKVSEVVTEKGRTRCNAVVLAGGSWSTFFCRSLGIYLPQLKLQSQFARTRPITGGPTGCGSGPGYAYRQRLDGGYGLYIRSQYPVQITPDSFRFARQYLPTLRHEWRNLKYGIGRQTWNELLIPSKWDLDKRTVFEDVRTLRPVGNGKIVARGIANIRKAYPGMSEIVINENVSGWLDVSPDAIPVISGVDRLPGFFIASSFSGHGFGIAPGAGELMAQIVMGETPFTDITPFRHSRFIDGSPIEHWPTSF